MDGDGYFDIGEQKQYNKNKDFVRSTIRIRLATNVNVRDLPTLKYFIKVLGVGNIYTIQKKDQVRLIFSKKDLINVILPLMKLYNLEFLTYKRAEQFALVTFILENNIIHWDSVPKDSNLMAKFIPKLVNDLINLDFFSLWLVGFTMAEGSFGIKANGSAFYQIKQKGINNYTIIKALCLLITGRESFPIKADSADCYQLTLLSKNDIQKVVGFFSSPCNLLLGYKLKQYNLWLIALKFSNRYKNIKIPNQINSNK